MKRASHGGVQSVYLLDPPRSEGEALAVLSGV
jgi:hypothetical protein